MKKHGLSHTTEYNSWKSARNRARNKNDKDYPRYGALGIGMCDDWYNSFNQFLKDMGEKPSKDHSLDRIDNKKGYYPDNCRWATRFEQQRNRKSNVKFNGETSAEASIRLGGCRQLVYRRLKNGWSKKEAFTKPITKNTPVA